MKASRKGSADGVRPPTEMRTRILNVTMKLLKAEGRDAITTRAVSQAAGIQPPIIYRLFGDKQGLLDAVAEFGFNSYISRKQSAPTTSDPVEALRFGWNLHIEFGLANPEIYLLMYAEPRPGEKSPAAKASFQILRNHIHQVAAVGRLRVSEERAANLFHAAGSGTVLTLLGMTQAERDMEISTIAREAVLSVIAKQASIKSKSLGSVEAAIALRAVLDDTAPLSEGERSLLEEWLDRLARR